jgi:hypothetical protein
MSRSGDSSESLRLPDINSEEVFQSDCLRPDLKSSGFFEINSGSNLSGGYTAA